VVSIELTEKVALSKDLRREESWSHRRERTNVQEEETSSERPTLALPGRQCGSRFRNPFYISDRHLHEIPFTFIFKILWGIITFVLLVILSLC
jgi:hypothetical protein